MFSFYEFFAGGGMARLGLGPRWVSLAANDNDLKKTAVYSAYFGSYNLIVRNIEKLKPRDLPGQADLAWASFPCQDLSLAGNGAGLDGDRSGTFWAFWRLMLNLRQQGRAPKLIVIENVYGTITSHQGRDFAAILGALTKAGYRVGPMVIDAINFVPQSRPRLFIIAAKEDLSLPHNLMFSVPTPLWHPTSLVTAHKTQMPRVRDQWLWWQLPHPKTEPLGLTNLIEDNPHGIEWHTQEETVRLLGLMSPLNRMKIEKAKRLRRKVIGTLYKRTRLQEDGRRMQRAEVRFDDVAGCLRTPAGGSSRQTIIVITGDQIRSRLLSTRETARLMGLPENYPLPSKYNDAYHLTGDGVVVPVVRHIAKHILEPILLAQPTALVKAA